MDDEAFETWRRRLQSGDTSATIIYLYELAGSRRGLQAHELPVEERSRLAHRALEAMVPGYEVVPHSDRVVDLIELVPYDREWPARFSDWRQKLEAALTPPARRIAHVGSTAVSGLAAKPVVDIQVSVDDMLNEDAYVPAIESLGVQLRSRDADHRFFRPFADRPRDVHIHVCNSGSVWERRHLLFVAYLQADAGARDEYLRAKQAALARWADDRIAYTEAKDGVIRAIDARAEIWARDTGWSDQPAGC